MIRDICMQHQKLVDKFLSTKLDPPHSNQVKSNCDRYFTLMDRISSWNVPEGETIPTHVVPNLPSSSMESQVCLLIFQSKFQIYNLSAWHYM